MIWRLAEPFVEWLVVLMVIFSAAYVIVMFDGKPGPEGLIEALNYSAQTITTVGYGNWVPSWWDLDKPELRSRVLRMKLLSVPFALFGATFFGLAIGIAANSVSRL